MTVTVTGSCSLNSEWSRVSPTRCWGEWWFPRQPTISSPSLTLLSMKSLSLSEPETDKKVSMGLQCPGHGSAWVFPGLTCLGIITCSIPPRYTGYIWQFSSPGQVCLASTLALTGCHSGSIRHRGHSPHALNLCCP